MFNISFWKPIICLYNYAHVYKRKHIDMVILSITWCCSLNLADILTCRIVLVVLYVFCLLAWTAPLQINGHKWYYSKHWDSSTVHVLFVIYITVLRVFIESRSKKEMKKKKKINEMLWKTKSQSGLPKYITKLSLYKKSDF